jgi:hypothetical protein
MATHIYDNGDLRLDDAPTVLGRRRARGKFAVMSLLGVALIALLGVTCSMHSRARDAAPVRMGTSR